MPERKPCRCLLKDSLPDMGQVVKDYVQSLPLEVRTNDEEYAKRLARCQSCDRLSDGTCMLCGCYVEARAAKQSQHCPRVPKLW